MKRTMAEAAAKAAPRIFKSDSPRPPVLKAPIRPSHRSAALPIRIVIADGHALMRDGLRALLNAEADFVVLAEANDAGRAVALVQELNADILLFDAALAPDEFEVLTQLQALNTPVRTILVTGATAQTNIVAALRLGVRGILSRRTPTDLLFRSIRRVQAGEVWIAREAVGDLVAALMRQSEAGSGPESRHDFGLTARERDVLSLIVEGETNKGIATRLSVGPDTVKHHLTSIFNKTGASNRLELALFALHYRLVRSQS